MSDAAFDQNSRTSILGISAIDYTSRVPVTVAAFPDIHALSIAIVDTTGDQISAVNPLPVEGTFTPSGTQDVNLIKIGGSSFTLGQKASIGSISVTLSTEDFAFIESIEAILDSWDETGRSAVNTISGQVGIQGGAGAVSANTTRVAIATDANAVTAVGTVADDSTTPGNPVMTGGFAKSPDGTTPGSVAEDDVARFTTDLNRRQFVNTVHPQWLSFHSDGSSALTDQSVFADPGDGFQVVITNIVFSLGAATAINFFLEEGSTKIFGPIYLEAVNGRGFVWQGEKKVTASTAVTITTSAAVAQSVDIQGYIQAV